MGYYTNHDITLIKKEENLTDQQVKECENAIREIAVDVSEDFDKDDPEAPLCFQAKWYDRQADLEELSTKHPGIIIQVDCEGEDGELWRERYLNGDAEMHDAIITYPEFDIQ